MDRPHEFFSKRGGKLLLFQKEIGIRNQPQSLRFLNPKNMFETNETSGFYPLEYILEYYKSNSYLRTVSKFKLRDITTRHPATIGPSLGLHFHEK